MKRLVVYIILTGLAVAAVAQANPQLKRARDAFWGSKFGTAADVYRQLIKEHPRQADLWYNLGTAEAQAGRMGPAAYAFEQALALEPRHPDASHNLDKVRAWVTGKALEKTSNQKIVLPGNDDVGTGLLAAMPLWEVRLTFAISWALLFIFIYGLRTVSKRRTALSFLTILVGLVAVSSGGLLLTRSYVVDQARYGVVLADSPAHQGPGTQYAVKTKVSNSVKVRLGGTDRNWRQVTLPNGQEVWMSSQAVGVIKP